MFGLDVELMWSRFTGHHIEGNLGIRVLVVSGWRYDLVHQGVDAHHAFDRASCTHAMPDIALDRRHRNRSRTFSEDQRNCFPFGKIAIFPTGVSRTISPRHCTN